MEKELEHTEPIPLPKETYLAFWGKTLAEARQEYNELNRQEEAAWKAVEQTAAFAIYEKYNKEKRAAKERVTNLEQHLRATGVNLYLHGVIDKNSHDHIGYIREGTSVEISDENEAKKWAIDSAQLQLLNINKRKFLKATKELELPFITKTPNPNFAIRSDLGTLVEDNYADRKSE